MAIEQILQDLTQSIKDLILATNALAVAQNLAAPASPTIASRRPGKTETTSAHTTQSIKLMPTTSQTPDFSYVQRTLANIAEKLGNPQPVVEIMQRMGAQRLSDIPAEKYGELLASAQALVG